MCDWWGWLGSVRPFCLIVGKETVLPPVSDFFVVCPTTHVEYYEVVSQSFYSYIICLFLSSLLFLYLYSLFNMVIFTLLQFGLHLF